ncbi:M20/M25/M40 family metallo-hydrolase [Bacteroidota bacterium]
MKFIKPTLAAFAVFLLSVSSLAQKKAVESITVDDLKMHLEFIASDELEGRETGEPGLNIAARYLAAQAAHVGLTPMNGDEGYLQHYIIEQKSYDLETSGIRIVSKDGDVRTNHEPFYAIPGVNKDTVKISGEVVFAGYGIKDDGNEYNDFAEIDMSGKIVLIMNRGPMNEDGTEGQFGDKYLGMQSIGSKMQELMKYQPKTILLVMDPKSGMLSLEDLRPGISNYLSRSRSMKKEGADPFEGARPPSMFIIHRTVADDLLNGTGKTLEELQRMIDQSLEPQSFLIGNKTIDICLVTKREDLSVPNVFGMLEGSDPELKDEIVIFMAHFDHVGKDASGGIYNGADDNGTGTVALIEIAEAFVNNKKPPKRSIGFLWVSAEEIGLFGSSYFADHPLVSLEQIAAAINMDMIGRTVSEEDIANGRKGMTIVGRDSVKVIGGKQSTVLMEINEKTLDEMGLHANYTYNDINHPDRYFYRSDHINFARKDIPVLFYSTGTHSDYHEQSDEISKIDFEKFQHMTRFIYKVGYNVANFQGEITVDNPMSEW